MCVCFGAYMASCIIQMHARGGLPAWIDKVTHAVPIMLTPEACASMNSPYKLAVTFIRRYKHACIMPYSEVMYIKSHVSR